MKGDGKKDRKLIRKLKRKLKEMELREKLEKVQRKLRRQERRVMKARAEARRLASEQEEKSDARRIRRVAEQKEKESEAVRSRARRGRPSPEEEGKALQARRVRPRTELSEKQREGREEKKRDFQPFTEEDESKPVQPREYGDKIKTLKRGQKLSPGQMKNIRDSGNIVIKFTYRNAAGSGDERWVTFSRNSVGSDTIANIITNNWWGSMNFDFEDEHESGGIQELINAEVITKIEIFKLPEPTRRRRQNQRVAAFNYVLSNYYGPIQKHLSIAQVYTTNNFDKRDTEQCLKHVFSSLGFENIDSIIFKHCVKRGLDGWTESTRIQPKKVLKEISTHIGRPIHLAYKRKDRTRWRNQHVVLNPQLPGETIFLGMIDNHIFRNIDVNVTKYFLRNPERCTTLTSNKDEENPESIYAIRVSQGYEYADRNVDKKFRMLEVLTTIMENPLLCVPYVPGENIFRKKDCLDTLSILEQKESNISEEKEEKKSGKEYIRTTTYFAADIETLITGEEHVPLMFGFYAMPVFCIEYNTRGLGKKTEYYPVTGRYEKIAGEGCAKGAFNWMTCRSHKIKKMDVEVQERFDLIQASLFNKDVKIEREATVFFHNLKYDFSVLKESIFKIQSIISKGVSTIYGTSFQHTFRSKRTKFTLKDSYKFMNWPLKDTAKNMGLSSDLTKKEFIAYSFFNFKNIDCSQPVDYQVYVDAYNAENKSNLTVDEFKKDLPAECFDEDGLFCPDAYYQYYLKYDCLILSAGMIRLEETLQNDLSEICEGLEVPSIFDRSVYTTPGFARKFFEANGALDGSFKAVGVLKEFLHESFYGGRVISNGKNSDKDMQYDDACSLYPSAMMELIEYLNGITNGEAVLLKDNEKTLEFLADKQDYTVRVRVTGMSKTQKCEIGILPERKKDKSVIYHWKYPDYQFTGVYGKILLEDAIDRLGLQFQIIEGVYWNKAEVPNKRYAEITQLLYDTRLKFKKTNPALATIIKLILNTGCYGCLARKPSYTKNALKTEKESLGYLANNFEEIERFRPINGNNVLFEVRSPDTNYTSVKIACNVLDMSKKIMNRVFSACSEAGVIVPYSDTDSFVIPVEKRAEIIQRYEEKTGRVYSGINLGQFHSDFSIKGLPKHMTEDDIVSKEFWNIGKKLYFHMLEAVDEKTGKTHTGYKMSSKGYTKSGLVEYSKQTFGIQDERLALRELFKSASEGSSHNINLYPTRATRIGYNANLTAHSICNEGETSFSRIFSKG